LRCNCCYYSWLLLLNLLLLLLLLVLLPLLPLLPPPMLLLLLLPMLLPLILMFSLPLLYLPLLLIMLRYRCCCYCCDTAIAATAAMPQLLPLLRYTIATIGAVTGCATIDVNAAAVTIVAHPLSGLHGNTPTPSWWHTWNASISQSRVIRLYCCCNQIGTC